MAASIARYDAQYFRKWYRDPESRVSTVASAERKARMALGVAEYYLERPVRTVLDVGCGEGQWEPVLRKLRAGIAYRGIDASEYAIQKWGKKRNLLLGTFGDLPDLLDDARYDLIVCSDMLYYVGTPDLKRGLAALAERLDGVAFLEAYTPDDAIEGDTHGWEPRDFAAWRKLFRQHGFTGCGPHCYVGEALAPMVMQLERGQV